MWSRSCKLLIALVLAELALIEPPLLSAGGYDQGQQAGQELLNRFGTPEALQQQLQNVPNYSDAARDQNLANPYYTQDPSTTTARTRLSQDVATQAGADQAAQTIRGRVVSPWSWSFGPASSLVAGMQGNLPTGATIDAGCRPVAFCAEPGGTSTQQTCQVSQSVEDVSCREIFTIQAAAGGGQEEIFTDGCAPYKQPPWWSWTTICRDAPGTAQCATYTKMIPQSGSFCVDHFLYMRIAQDNSNQVLFQVLDTSPDNLPHWNCDSGGDFGDWHTVSQIPIAQFNGPPTFTLTASGSGCSSNTLTVSGIGGEAPVITCPQSGPQTTTLSWSIPVSTETCHDCWDRERTFGNSTVLSSTCGPLEAQGCNPSGQRCLSDDCTTVERTFTCYDNTACGRWEDQLVCSACTPDPPGPPRCVDESYPANGDFLIAAATMEGQVTMAADHTAAVQVFPGEREGCTSNILVDCCDAGKDAAKQLQTSIGAIQLSITAIRLSYTILDVYIALTSPFGTFLSSTTAAQFVASVNTYMQLGQSLFQAVGQTIVNSVSSVASSGATGLVQGFTNYIFSFGGVLLAIQVGVMAVQMLAQCSQNSIRASTKEHLGLCHEVGDYCSVQLLFFCAETMTRFCCFSTLLARIIQEQGRAQLGIDWGTAHEPNCGGLTVEQLQAIDFTQIDLTEYIADLQRRMTWPTAQTTQVRADQTAGGDYQGQAQQWLAQAGSGAPRIQSAISPPGGWQAGVLPSVTLSLTVIGSGVVTVSSGGSCGGGTCVIAVPSDTPVTLTTSPGAGWSFSGWTGPCSGVGTCELTLSGNTAVTVTFTQEQFQLAVSVAGSGTVTSSPAGITCVSGSCTALFALGSVVTLTATPTSSWRLRDWDGDCTATGTCTITMTATRSVSAVFTQGPQISSFSAATALPAPAGSTITWTTTTVDGIPPIEFEYTREDGATSTVVQPYSSASSYTWVTGPPDVGPHRLQVVVRNAGSTAQYEDWRISDPFDILSPVLVTSVIPGSASRGTNVSVTINGQSFRAGNTVAVSGGGITVSGVAVVGNGELQATFTIDLGAALGARNVTVTDPAGASATGVGVFTVQ